MKAVLRAIVLALLLGEVVGNTAATPYTAAAPATIGTQYSAQVLLPPADMNSGCQTHAYVMNNVGQVFGSAGGFNFCGVGASGSGVAPVLWTNGVPQRLPIPDGYYWVTNTLGQHLLDDGTVVSVLGFPDHTPTTPDHWYVVLWKDGVARIAPSLPTSPQCVWNGQQIPVGTNSAGHVLVYGVPSCLAVWDGGTGFQNVNGALAGGVNFFVASPDRLSSDDRIAVDRVATQAAPTPGTGIFANGVYTELAIGVTSGFNDLGQLLAGDTSNSGTGNCAFWRSWNGTVLTNLGLSRSAYQNDAGEVLLVGAGCQAGASGAWVAQIYRNGTFSNLSLAPDTVGLSSLGLLACNPPAQFNTRHQFFVGACTALSPTFHDALVTPTTTTPPQITAPASLTAEATGPTGAVVSFQLSAVASDGGPTTITCLPASGSLFPLGVTHVACTAVDDTNNTATAGFPVTVVDMTRPVLTLPANLEIGTTSTAGSPVTFAASAVDLVSGQPAVVCSPASGATFPIGTTVVTCTANDAAGNTATGTFVVTLVYTLSPGSFVATGNMNVPRSLFTLTTLGNGGALVAGGYHVGNLSAATATAELYDPIAGQFTMTGTMSMARTGHSATRLHDGRVLIVGGYDGTSGVTASAEIFDPVTGVFTPTGSLSAARGSHTATLLNDGRVLIAGGATAQGLGVSPAELYDPANGTFGPTGSLVTARYVHTATLLTDGRVLLAGGRNQSAVLASAELYDPQAGSFAPTGSMTSVRAYFTATRLRDGTVLAAGGTNIFNVFAAAEIYDPASGLFTRTGDMVGPLYAQSATLLNDGHVLVVGGSSGPRAQADAEFFDPATGLFVSAGVIPNVRKDHSATLLGNGKALIAGGWDFHNVLSSAVLFAPADATPPTIVAPTSVTAESTEPGGATVTYAASASDAVDGTVPIACDPASGSLFPLGSTTVTCSASDQAGNTASATFSVTVVKRSAILVITNLDQTYDGSPKAVTVTATPPDASGISVTYDGSPAAPTHPGVYQVLVTLQSDTYSANDVSGTLVIARATTHLSWTVVPTITYGTALSSLFNASADVPGTFSYSPPGNGPQSVGEYLLTAAFSPTNVTDYQDTTLNRFVTITSAMPTIAVAPVTAAHDGQPHPVSPSVTGVLGETLGALTVTYNGLGAPPVGVGSYAVVVSYAGSDNYQAASAGTTVTITDATPPVIDPSADIIVEATGPGGAPASYATPRAIDGVDGTLAVSCSPASGSLFPIGATTVSCAAADHSGNVAHASFHVTVRDTVAPTVMISSPAASGIYLLNQVVAAAYSCVDGGSGVVSCVGTVPSGAGVPTSTAGAKVMTVMATDAAGNSASASVGYIVRYGVKTLYDETKALKGATVGIKLQLADVNGANVSSLSTAVSASLVAFVGSTATVAAEDTGNSNPDGNFSFDPTTASYHFNLSVKGLSPGAYRLNFIVSGDPTTHTVGFVVGR